jgi:tetratricopeptide (TPR) repeat protein
LARDLGDRSLQIRSSFMVASLRARFEAALNQAVEELKAGLKLAKSAKLNSLEMEGHLRLGTILFNTGKIVEAGQAFSACALIARQEGSLRAEAGSTQFLGLVQYYLGNLEEAEKLTLQSLEWFERTADRYLQAQNMRSLAKFALAREDFEGAEKWLREALSIAAEIGGWLLVEIYRYLAEALARQGRIDEARDAADAARSSLAEEENPYAKGAVLMAEGFVSWAAKDEEKSRRAFEDAMPLIEQAGYEIDLAEGQMFYGEVLTQFGDLEAATAQLLDAKAKFEKVQAKGLADEVARRLTQLGDRA